MSNAIILYFEPFFIAFLASFVIVKLLIKSGIGSDNSGKDKKYLNKTFRIGGIAMIFSFLSAILLDGDLVIDTLKAGIILSSLLILIFGVYDDFRNLSWKKQLLIQVSIALIMIYMGLNVDYIANPFGGREFRLDQLQYSIFNIQFSIFGSLFVLFWIVGFMNVMNWLDGLDGLAGGVSFIGSITLFLISISDLVNQPPLAIMAIALAGSILGFLFFNMYPARIFMGTSGSYFLGFMLSVLAIFSGGKIATVLLIMGFPIIDALWVMAGRIRSGGSPFKGDGRHLHYRLLERGWSEKKIVTFVYVICSMFAAAAILFQNVGKLISLLLLFIMANYFIYEFGVKEQKGKIIDTKQQ